MTNGDPQIPSAGAGAPWAGQTETDVTVCYADDEPARLSRVADELGRIDRLSVETAATPAAVLARLEAFDCVVVDHGPDERDALDLVRSVREAAPRLPVVVRVVDADADADADAGATADVVDAGAIDEWIAVVPAGGAVDDLGPLAERIRRLVDHRRLVGHARRTRAGLDVGGDPIVLVDADDTVDFVNEAAIDRVGHEPSGIVGRDWRRLFDDESIDRLEADALPSVADGWRWTGTCVLSGPDGTEAVRTRVVGLDADGLVFAFDPDDAD